MTTSMAQRLWLHKGTQSEGALVFQSETGTVLIARNVLMRVLKPAAKRAGVDWANLHTLRHTRITDLLRSGWNPKQVQMFAGHHSPAFTLERYCHLLPDDLPEPPVLPEMETHEGATHGQQDTPSQPETDVAGSAG
jgi:integrase